LYESKSLGRSDQEQQYIKAIEFLVAKSSQNAEMKDFFIKQLLQEFQFGDYDVIGAYINETYLLKDQCESDGTEVAIKERIEKIRRVSVGKKAPEITMVNPLGKVLRLYEIPTNYVILVFWSTGCPHCTAMMPDLKRLYASIKNNSIEIVAIANDTDQKTWKDFITAGEYDWINYTDLKGRNSPILNDYNIVGTPTFFLLDKNKNILSKPNDIADLEQKLISLGLLK
jgi:peroxiredoxin